MFSIIRHMDTSLCDVDVQPTYVKVTLKGKVSCWAVDAAAWWSQVKVMGSGLWNGTCCLAVIAGATYLVHCLCDSFEGWATIDKIYRCSIFKWVLVTWLDRAQDSAVVPVIVARALRRIAFLLTNQGHTWTNADFLSYRLPRTNINGFWIKIQWISFKEMYLKMLSAKFSHLDQT